MASGIANLGAARRGLIKSEKKYAAFSDILGTASTTLAFLGVQAKKSKTAWDEYEAGYKALGGDPADIEERTGLFKHFQMPKGEVRIGTQMHDRRDIRMAGGVLGSDIGKMLDEKARGAYAKRTAPGRDLTVEEKSATRESLRPRIPYDVLGMSVTAKDDDYNVEGQDFGEIIPETEPGFSEFGDWGTPVGGTLEQWKAQQAALMEYQNKRFIEGEKKFLFEDPAVGSGLNVSRTQGMQEPILVTPNYKSEDESFNPFKNLIETYGEKWK